MNINQYKRLLELAKTSGVCHKWVSVLEYKAFLFGSKIPKNARKR